MLEKYIEVIKPYIIEWFKNDSSGHDISHLIRTMNIALNLCKKENGDELIVGISAFMHDIHRIMQNETGKFVSPKDSLPKVREILSNTDLSEEIINKICKRFRTFRLKKELGIPTVLYIKPVLQGITINDVEEYKEVIRNYGIQDVVVGSLFTEQQNSGTVHFLNENKLFYNPVSDEEVIKRQLSECARVYTRSSQVMQQYREKELSES